MSNEFLMQVIDETIVAIDHAKLFVYLDFSGGHFSSCEKISTDQARVGSVITLDKSAAGSNGTDEIRILSHSALSEGSKAAINSPLFTVFTEFAEYGFDVLIEIVFALQLSIT